MTDTPLRDGRPTGAVRWAGWAILLYGSVLRLVFPRADPVHPQWTGWIVDEARWTELAREWALFGAPDPDTGVSVMHIVLAPVYQILSGGVFGVLGVGFVTARLISAVAGVAVLLLVARRLQPMLHPHAWLVTVLLAAVHPELVYFSRLAIPEMTALFLHTVAFILLVQGPSTARRTFLAGLVTAVAVGAKATTAPVALAFLVVAGVTRGGGMDASPRRRVGAYLGGLVLPGIVLLVLAGVVMGFPVPLLGNAGGIQEILDVARFDSAYGVATTLYGGYAASHVNLLLVVLWPMALAVWLRGSSDPEGRRLFAGSILWAAGSFVPWWVLSYFPDRYLVHLYLPLVLAAGAALSLLMGPGDRSLREGFAALSPPRRVMVAVLAALPLAAVLAPSALALLDLAGLRLVQFRSHMLVMGVLAALAGGRSALRGRMPLGVATVAFPLWAVLLFWLAAGPVGGDQVLGRYWRVAGSEVLLPWLLVLVPAAVLSLAAARTVRGTDAATRIARWSVAYGVGLAVVWSLTLHLPFLTQRSYAMSAAAAHLTERYDPGRVMGVTAAASVFVGTPFRYREVLGEEGMPDVLLSSSHPTMAAPPDTAISNHYRVVREFQVPGIEYGAGSRSARTTIRLHERRATPPLPQRSTSLLYTDPTTRPRAYPITNPYTKPITLPAQVTEYPGRK